MSLLTFLIVVGAIITSVTVFLKVANIQVTGNTKYTSEEIVAESGIKVGDNMFMVNKFDVADRILKKYPYIEQIKIRRHLPDTFTFEITERTPAGYVVSDGNRWLVDKNAYILEMIPEGTNVSVPKVVGAEVLAPSVGARLVLKNEDRMKALKEVLGALCETGLCPNVGRIEISKLYSINLIYANRFRVNLGDASELTKKIEMLKAVINELNDFDKGEINVSAIKEARFRPNNDIDLSEKPEDSVPSESGAESDGKKFGSTGENQKDNSDSGTDAGQKEPAPESENKQ